MIITPDLSGTGFPVFDGSRDVGGTALDAFRRKHGGRFRTVGADTTNAPTLDHRSGSVGAWVAGGETGDV